MPDLLILFSIWIKFLSFDIVNFGFPQSLENMCYAFRSFKLFSGGYKHVSSTYWAISPPREIGGEIAQLILNFYQRVQFHILSFWFLIFF